MEKNTRFLNMMLGQSFCKTLKKSVFNSVYLFLIFLLGFPGGAKVYGGTVVDRIVAIVNSDIITLFELNQMLKPYKEKLIAAGYNSEKTQRMLFKIRDDLINQLIEQKLTDQEVKRSKITVSEKEIDETTEQIKERNFFTDEDLTEALRKDGYSIEEFRNNTKEQMLRAKLIDYQIKLKIIVTKEDIKSYYESHIDQYQGIKQYHLKNILMKPSLLAVTGERLEIKKKMEKILGKLQAGHSFEKMAGTYSEAQFADQGGELGTFGFDDLSPQIQQALKGLKKKEFTSVIDTDQGYQIFFIDDISKTKGKSLGEVSPEIEKILYYEITEKQFKSWLVDLRTQSYIKIIK